MHVYAPGAEGYSEEQRDVTLNGQDETVSFGVHYDNLGEFALYGAAGHEYVVDDAGHVYDELGFVGIPSAVLPGYGIAQYTGEALLTLTGGGPPRGGGPVSVGSDAVWTDAVSWANFANAAVVGYVYDHELDRTLYTYGTISDTELVGLRLLGSLPLPVSGPPRTFPSTPASVAGDGSFGQFYGSAFQGLGFSGAGVLTDAQTGSPVAGVQFLGGLFRQTTELGSSPAGTTFWKGFAIGVGQYAFDPTFSPYLFSNVSSEGLAMTIGRDAGTVAGLMLLEESELGEFLDLAVGGVHGSAYVDDNTLLAEFGDNVRTAVSLDPGANLMVSSLDGEELSDWTSWGYWGASYTGGAEPYVIDLPAGYWIAGERTSRAYIMSLANTVGIMGVYEGGARCTEVLSTGALHMMQGTSSFDVFFDTGEITGTLDFAGDGVSMNASATIADGGAGFVGSILDVSLARSGVRQVPDSSSLQGDFFGPTAEAIGGSFNAETLSNGSQYIGVFAGDRQ